MWQNNFFLIKFLFYTQKCFTLSPIQKMKQMSTYNFPATYNESYKRWFLPIYIRSNDFGSEREFLEKKRKVLRILWFGEKVDQKNFLKILPPPQRIFSFSLKKMKSA